MSWTHRSELKELPPATQPLRPHEVAIGATDRLRNRHAVLVHELKRIEEELVRRKCIAEPLTIKKED